VNTTLLEATSYKKYSPLTKSTLLFLHAQPEQRACDLAPRRRSGIRA
jgi:hypothetical protein